MADSTSVADPAVHTQLDGIRGLLERQEKSRETERRSRVDRWLGLAGSILVPAGLVTILLGWYGAAHTPYVFEQIPYLISGGLLGVGMVIGGGLLFFGSWVARMEEDAPATEELVAAVDRLRVELLAGGAAVLGAGSTNGSSFVATPTGTMLHRPDCSVVHGRESDALIMVSADEEGYRPCKLCDPHEN